MDRVTRRDFIKSTAAVSVIAGSGGLAAPAQAARRSFSDLVTLGNSGVRFPRLAFGTGTLSGRPYVAMGQENFTRLIRHAYDRGIRWFETAEVYDQIHEMLAVALKGIPRDTYKLSSKLRIRPGDDPWAMINRMRNELNTDQIEILLVHGMRLTSWPEDQKPLRDALSEAKVKKVILAHGASCHGLVALRSFVGLDWLDVVLIRINHNGTRMDSLRNTSPEIGDVPEVVSLVKKIHDQGTGVLGMKLCGEGRFTSAEDREAALKFVLGLGTVDAVTIGYKTTAEIDETIERVNRNLNA